MAYVRCVYQAAPVRCAYQAAPVRPVLPNSEGAHIRPFLINHQAMPRVPIYHRPPMAARRPLPQYLPVLQPPIYPRESKLDDDEQQYQQEMFNYPTVMLTDQHTTAQQLSHSASTFMPYPNYTQQSFRYSTPNYPLYTYYNR